jgi:hypothetical protein
MSEEERDRICPAWLTYQRNWWAYSSVDRLVSEDPEEAWALMLRIIELADNDELIEAVGAGPLEDLISKHGPKLINRVKDESVQNGRLRAALQHVWLSPAENEVLDELLELGCKLVTSKRDSDA